MWSRDKDGRTAIWTVDDATDMGTGRTPTSNMGAVEWARDAADPWVTSDRTSSVSKELFPTGLKTEDCADVMAEVGPEPTVEVGRRGGSARDAKPSELPTNPL